MKILSPKIHGYLDYAVILILAIAPSLLNFTREASAVSYTLAGIHLVMVLATAYPFGLFKAIPFTVHGTIELILSPLLVALPWIAGFDEHAASRNFFIVAGVALFSVWLTTDYKAADIEYRKKGVDMGGHTRGAHA
ncbi:MAG: hypothetical protein M3Y08_14310 [Fibrobacterota bacterium]|nr:hypothetical protein [Fibrobacterota bacterium]